MSYQTPSSHSVGTESKTQIGLTSSAETGLTSFTTPAQSDQHIESEKPKPLLW